MLYTIGDVSMIHDSHRKTSDSALNLCTIIGTITLNTDKKTFFLNFLSLILATELS